MVSGAALTNLLALAIYAAVCAFAYRRLFPRLAPKLARLPLLLLAAQTLLLLAHYAIPQSREFWHWFFHLDKELNLPNLLASTQLAFVSALALITARCQHSKSKWQSRYFLALGFVFLFLAQEEFTGAYKSGSVLFSEAIPWTTLTRILGGSIAALTVLAALRSPPRIRLCHTWFLAGFALMGFAGLLVDEMPRYCNLRLLVQIDGCITRYLIDESAEFLGVWLTLCAMLGHFSAASPAPSRRLRRALFLLPFIWNPLLIAYPLYLTLEAPLLAQPAKVLLEANAYEYDTWLLGYRLGRSNSMIALELFTVAKRRAHASRGYSVHLVDQASAESIAGVDTHWKPAAGPIFGAGRPHAYRQRIDLAIPPETAANRALWVVLTFWRELDGEFTSVAVVSSDLALLSQTQVILGEIVLPAEPLAVPTDTLAEFDNGIALYDVVLPATARIGNTLSLTFTWGSDAREHEEYVQYLHVGHVESGEWWILDRQPLGARLPTRLWYSGLVDSETWEIPIPADRERGEYHVFTGLYRTRDRERLPARDVASAPFLDARVPLGAIIIN